MDATQTLQFRTKISKAIGFSLLFVVLTAAVILVSFEADLTISIEFLVVMALLLGVFIVQLMKSSSRAKGLQLAITLISGLVVLLLLYFFPRWTLLVIGCGLFGVLGGYYVWVNLITRQPMIEASPQELRLFNGFFRGKSFAIKWANVEAFGLDEQHIFGGSKHIYLGVKLRSEEEFLRLNDEEKSKMLAKSMALNNKMFGCPITADITQLEISGDELIDRLQQFLHA